MKMKVVLPKMGESDTAPAAGRQQQLGQRRRGTTKQKASPHPPGRRQFTVGEDAGKRPDAIDDDVDNVVPHLFGGVKGAGVALPTISDAESMPARKLEDADYMARKLLLPTLLMQAANASSMSNRKDSSALQLEVAGQDLQLPQPRKQGQFRDKNAPGRRMNWQTSLQTLPEDEDKEDWTFDEGVEETEAAHLRHVLQCHSLGIPVQIKQLDYRPGRCAVPIFHCARCLDNWQTSGNIPQDCAEPEGLVEGPEIEITTRVFTYIRNIWMSHLSKGQFHVAEHTQKEKSLLGEIRKAMGAPAKTNYSSDPDPRPCRDTYSGVGGERLTAVSQTLSQDVDPKGSGRKAAVPYATKFSTTASTSRASPSTASKVPLPLDKPGTIRSSLSTLGSDSESERIFSSSEHDTWSDWTDWSETSMSGDKDGHIIYQVKDATIAPKLQRRDPMGLEARDQILAKNRDQRNKTEAKADSVDSSDECDEAYSTVFSESEETFILPGKQTAGDLNDPSYDHLIRTLIDDYEQSVSPRSQEGRYDDRGSDSGRRSTKEGVMGRGQTGRRMTENLARDPSRAPQQPVSPSTSETSSDVQSRERLSRRDVTSPEFDRNARRPSKASRPRRSSGEQVLLDHGMVDPVQRDLGKEHTKAIVMNPLAKNKTGKPSTRSGHLKSAVLPTHTYDSTPKTSLVSLDGEQSTAEFRGVVYDGPSDKQSAPSRGSRRVPVPKSSGGGTKKVDVVLGDESQGATEAAEASSRWKPRTAKHQRKGSLVKDRQGSTALPYHSRQLDQDLPQDGAAGGGAESQQEDSRYTEQQPMKAGARDNEKVVESRLSLRQRPADLSSSLRLQTGSGQQTSANTPCTGISNEPPCQSSPRQQEASHSERSTHPFTAQSQTGTSHGRPIAQVKPSVIQRGTVSHGNMNGSSASSSTSPHSSTSESLAESVPMVLPDFGGISTLSFTPAFTFSLYPMPPQYSRRNAEYNRQKVTQKPPQKRAPLKPPRKGTEKQDVIKMEMAKRQTTDLSKIAKKVHRKVINPKPIAKYVKKLQPLTEVVPPRAEKSLTKKKVLPAIRRDQSSVTSRSSHNAALNRSKSRSRHQRTSEVKQRGSESKRSIEKPGCSSKRNLHRRTESKKSDVSPSRTSKTGLHRRTESKKSGERLGPSKTGLHQRTESKKSGERLGPSKTGLHQRTESKKSGERLGPSKTGLHQRTEYKKSGERLGPSKTGLHQRTEYKKSGERLGRTSKPGLHRRTESKKSAKNVGGSFKPNSHKKIMKVDKAKGVETMKPPGKHRLSHSRGSLERISDRMDSDFWFQSSSTLYEFEVDVDDHGLHESESILISVRDYD